MQQDRTLLFEETPIPKAVATLAVPTILSSLVMVLYNLADTYFVGMLNDPIQNAAVTLAAPVLLAFNAVNNLFGVGSSSMMSRALGRRDYDTVARSSSLRLLLRHPLRHWSSPCSASCSRAPCWACWARTTTTRGRHRCLYVLDRHLRRCPGDPQRRHGLYGAFRGLLPCTPASAP